MAKRATCQHGNPAFKFDGCFQCIQRIMGADQILRRLGVDPPTLMEILRDKFPDNESWGNAVASAKVKVAKLEAIEREKTKATP